jgi:hypothetical protein
MAEAPQRSRLLRGSASREQAAAIAAALERFMQATAPAGAAPSEELEQWQRAAILEGVSREPRGEAPEPWINT